MSCENRHIVDKVQPSLLLICLLGWLNWNKFVGLAWI